MEVPPRAPRAPRAAVDHLGVLGTLGEPNRRALYDYVVSAGRWVGRDEAAREAGLQRGVAAHHLDRLAAEGLLEVDYQRLSGRSGPGAGRPAKLYRRSRHDFEVTLPPRDYEFAARLLADALADAQTSGADVASTIDSAATAAGRELGRAINDRLGGRRGVDDVRKAVTGALGEHGFEPTDHPDGTVTLRNCPFHLLAQRHTDLICGMNRTLIDAALAEVDGCPFEAVLQPDPATCCVRLRQSSSAIYMVETSERK